MEKIPRPVLSAYARNARKATRKLVKRAFKDGAPEGSFLEVKMYGRLRQEAWMEIGWHPEVESPVQGQSYTSLTLRWELLRDTRI